jgi:hypothetical protein
LQVASADRDLPEPEKRLAARVLHETRLLYADVLGLIGRLCLAQVWHHETLGASSVEKALTIWIAVVTWDVLYETHIVS